MTDLRDHLRVVHEGKRTDLREQEAEYRKRRNSGPDGARVLPPPSEPMKVARVLAGERYQLEDGTPTLRHWRGGWWEWRQSRWIEIEQRAARATAWHFTEHAVYEKQDKNGNKSIEPWSPNRHKIADLLEAVAANVLLPESVNQPTWLDAGHDGVIVACANGLLDVERRELVEHTPKFFNLTAVPFDYDPNASAPMVWFEFLDDLWGDDVESVNALQEWLGYVISGRLDLHKILLLVGPTRAGKGVIARTLTALVGGDNVAGPTLSSLSGDFGLAPLLGKPLAIVSDARLSGRNSQVVVERLLSISGEDSITVNRKYRDQWTGKLPSRFLVISNELPQLGDASAAIAGRFVTLLLTQSWYGNEDTTLEGRIHAELPGILNWALDGLARLERQGRFTKPASTDEAYITLQDLASPVGAFIRDLCALDIGHEIPVDDLWKAWKAWAEDNGHRPGNVAVFGRNLRAAHPAIRRTRPRDGEERVPMYHGITRGRSRRGCREQRPHWPGPRPIATQTALGRDGPRPNAM
jgi:putative DNA primase/helicase